MTAYQLLPGLTPEEYGALRDDIVAHGIRVPVDVDENGQVLDGHHRSLIAAELGIDCPRRTVAGLSEAEKVAHALAVNVHRRSLTQQQKRELLAVSIKAEPEASDREHARRVGTSKNTAATVRDELESTGQIDQLPTRVGADGRSRPAAITHTTTEKTVEEFVADRETGEVLSVEDWQQQEAHPVAAARAEVARQPVMLTGKAVERLKVARQTFEAAGTPADVVADLANTLPELDNSGFWLAEIEAAMGVLNGLAVALRRRNLRSVSR